MASEPANTKGVSKGHTDQTGAKTVVSTEANTKGTPNPNANDNSPGLFDNADPVLTSHLSLRITTPDDEAALKALLPYLALGFTTVNALDSGQPRYFNGFEALHISFDAARKGLFEHDPKKFRSTDRNMWRAWFNDKKLYDKSVHDYLTRREKLQPGEYLYNRSFANLTKTVRDRPLTFRQMACLLEVTNSEYGVKFQLGVILSGHRGRYDPTTGHIDESYVQQSSLRVDWSLRKKEETDKPVLWIYDTNRDEESLDHREKQDERLNVSRNRLKGLAPCNRIDPASQSRIERVEQFCIGKRLIDDIAGKLWILVIDHNSLASDIHCLAGTSLRPEENPTLSKNDFLHLRSPRGNDGAVKGKYLTQITQNLNQLSAETDNKWAITDDQTSSEDPENVKKIKYKKCKFYRVVPGTLRNGHFSRHKDRNTDPAFKNIGSFRLEDGDIVMGTDRRDKRRHLREENLAVHVIKHNGNEGWAYSRRFQLLENPFGLKDMLPVSTRYEPFPPDAQRGDAEPVYISYIFHLRLY